MNKYYEIKENNDNVHIIISNKGYGKTYYERKRIIDKNKKDLIKRIKESVFKECREDNFSIYENDLITKVVAIVEKEIWNYE